MYVIDGIFLTRRTTGIQRFALNIVKSLDRLAPAGQLKLLIPEYCEAQADLQNIEVIRYGRRKGYIWEQTDLARYLSKNKAQGIFLENAIPVFYRHGIVALHDISLKVNPDFFSGSGRLLMTRLIWNFIYRRIMTSKMRIVTVSQFSRSEILKTYAIDADRITVIHNAWQHMNDIVPDSDILRRLSLKSGEYFFSMATNAPNKNLKWILSAARCNPDSVFVIAGLGTDMASKESIPENVITAGFVTDSEAKALMAGCRAFLFPTFYEGFGIPPMEALSSGAPSLVLSDTACMHEIYGDIAGYIDPFEYENITIPVVTLDREQKKSFLGRYSWEGSARRLLEMLT